MHTKKTAHFALVGTRDDRVGNPRSRESISTLLSDALSDITGFSPVLNRAGVGSRGVTTLYFFPVDCVGGFSTNGVKTLLRAIEHEISTSAFVKKMVPFTWAKGCLLYTSDAADE